jgi:hypothetical protein
MKLWKNKKLDCYESLDTLPMWWWYMITKDGDLRHLCKSKVEAVTENQSKQLLDLFNSLNTDYIKRYGFPDEVLDVLRKEKQLTRLQRKYIRSNIAEPGQPPKSDASLLTFIEIAERELEAITQENKGQHIYKTKTRIESILHVTIDLMKISVAEYHEKCELAGEIIKSKNAA